MASTYERLFFLVAIILFSYALKRAKVFKEEDAKVFIDFVIYFSLPLTVVDSIKGLDSGRVALEVAGFAWSTMLFSSALALLVGKLLGLKGRTFRSFILVSTLGNTAFLGYPYAYALFGEEGLKYAILYDQLGSFLAVITLGLLVATGRFSLREILSFPPFWGLVLGFVLMGKELPPYAERLLQVASDSLIPVILFSLGLKLNLRGIKESIGLSTVSIGLKMVAVPLVLALLLKVLGLSQLHHKVVLLESSMPAMVMSAVLAIKYGLDAKLAVSAVTLGIFVSFLTVPLILGIV